MKKVIRIFLLAIGVFVIGGCNKEVVTDVSSINYLDNSSKENIAYNLSESISAIKGFKFKGNIKIKDKNYVFNGEIILKKSIKDSLIHINYKDSNIYLKNGNVYISYYYNNTNVIVKDRLSVFLDEIFKLLEENNIEFSERKILDVISNKGIQDINFNKISEFVEIEDKGYLIEYKNSKTYLDDNYFPVKFEFLKKGISLDMVFEYTPVSINVPIGYNLLDMDIEGIKDLLKVENITDLIDKKW